ncbi:MAG: hypothetical protein ACTSWE_04705, partial [Promethearchaeota archaeon]
SAEQYIPINGGNVLVSVGGEELKKKVIPLAIKLKKLGFKIYATEDTAKALKANNIDAIKLYKIHEHGMQPNIKQYLQEGQIDMVINIPMPSTAENKFRTILEDEYLIRRMAVDYNIPVLINLQLANAVVNAIKKLRRRKTFSVKSLNDYHQMLKEIYW